MEKKKMKLWKKILIVILVIIALFLFHVIRNLIIINSISSKLSKLEDSNNYKLTSYSYNGNNFVVTNYYFKDGKSLEKDILISSNRNGNIEIIKVFDGKTLETYTISEDEKVNLISDEKYVEPLRFYNELDTGSFWNNVIMATITRISTEECNGRKCYMAKIFLVDDYFRLYYDKETGLMVRDETSSFTSKKGV